MMSVQHGPGQPALGDPAGAGGLDQVTSRDPFPTQSFCEAVILWLLKQCHVVLISSVLTHH